jgi:hypothetical protein
LEEFADLSRLTLGSGEPGLHPRVYLRKQGDRLLQNVDDLRVRNTLEILRELLELRKPLFQKLYSSSFPPFIDLGLYIILPARSFASSTVVLIWRVLGTARCQPEDRAERSYEQERRDERQYPPHEQAVTRAPQKVGDYPGDSDDQRHSP